MYTSYANKPTTSNHYHILPDIIQIRDKTDKPPYILKALALTTSRNSPHYEVVKWLLALRAFPLYTNKQILILITT